jgi:hypothetical protein
VNQKWWLKSSDREFGLLYTVAHLSIGICDKNLVGNTPYISSTIFIGIFEDRDSKGQQLRKYQLPILSPSPLYKQL